MTIIRNPRHPVTDASLIVDTMVAVRDLGSHTQAAVITQETTQTDYAGATQTFGGAWNGSHLVIGSAHVWQDATGALRQKNGVPASDLDGALL